jgi:flagellin
MARGQSDIAATMARLSSGLRINSAKDDAAGLAIAERMTTQVRGLNVASRNANDAISLAQTAEGALGNVTSALQRIRELAVQAANATNSDSDRAALNLEAQELIAEVQRLSADTEFNGTKLLDGSFTAQKFQVGANGGQQLTIESIANAQSNALGVGKLSLAGTAMGVAGPGNVVVAETDLALTVDGKTSPPIVWSAGASAKDIASAISAQAGPLGVKATATNEATLSNLSVTASPLSFALNGKNISAEIASGNDLTALVDAINGAGAGVTASFASSSGKDSIKLTAADGTDISLGAATNGTFSLKGLLDPTTPAAAATARTVVGTVDISSNAGAIEWANAAATEFASASGVTSFESVATIDLATADSAVNALSVIDNSLDRLNTARASLGATQNRLESLIMNIDTMSENVTAARGRLMDADFAKETAELSRQQILQQASTAMLAQANALPQQVLKLLQG